VDVQFVLDRDNPDSVASALRNELGAARVVVCRETQPSGACIGSNINHNKLFLFSELADGSRHVVVQSSQNFTTTQLKQWNNTVVIRDDVALYNAYSSYWKDLKEQILNPDYYVSVVGDTGTKAYFFPRSSGDTIEAVLDNVSCAGGTAIHVAMAFFSDPRLGVAQRLASRSKAGCVVRVIVNPDHLDSGIADALAAGDVELVRFSATTGESVHSKYLLIGGGYVASL
jgi:hypothetical protein